MASATKTKKTSTKKDSTSQDNSSQESIEATDSPDEFEPDPSKVQSIGLDDLTRFAGLEAVVADLVVQVNDILVGTIEALRAVERQKSYNLAESLTEKYVEEK